MKDLTNYVEGEGCKCFAQYAHECCCDGVDWTPIEVYELENKLETKEKIIKDLKSKNEKLKKKIKLLEEQIK